ncbi:Aste57867_23525 [Aphanomyces stellatus]|uniref:Aste57867_23525 protein n=1 Tax=Aphanomyces stellatus TaxID=120398 RepID=A0A485LN19_9STRA|nr:hypothetical protein As57867_023454 [Aphanomyces stellatus]VFU00170.1 Aste57867_23525 [Aphanomyces stellatus]
MMESINLDRSGNYGGNRGSQEHNMPSSSSGYPSTNSTLSTGQKKTDQVVLEFLYKTVEVVLLSRAYFQPTTPRRARFNLDIQELTHVRESLRPYRDNVGQPLFLDIFMGSTLLERWHISYTSGMQSKSPVDVINQLREVCRRIGILLRTVYCLVRILPAFPVGTRLKTQQEDLGHVVAGLQYAVGAVDADMRQQFDAAEPKQRYSFVPIETPFGMIQLSVLYRKRNDDLLAAIQLMAPASAATKQAAAPLPVGDLDEHVSLQTSRTLDNAVIQDYVPTTPKAHKVTPPSPILTAIPRTPGAAAMQVVQEDHDDGTSSISSDYSMMSRRNSSMDDVGHHRTSQPVRIPQSAARAPPAKAVAHPPAIAGRRDPNPTFQHAHSYDPADPLRQRPTTPLAAPYGYIHARPADNPIKQQQYQQPPSSYLSSTPPVHSPSPRLHPNSAPLPRASPRATSMPPTTTTMMSSNPPLDGFVLDAFKPGSLESTRSSSNGGGGSSLPPFSVFGNPTRATSALGVSQSPPFRGYSGELLSASPTTSTPPTRITFKERRGSVDVGSNWGISPDTPDAFGLGKDDTELCLPFAAKSTREATMNVSTFLQQLKQAPPLHGTGGSAMAAVELELAYFKQLRDELE